MIVDDSASFREALERRFARNKFNPTTPYRTIAADSASAAIDMISAGVGPVDAFLIDIRMETDHAGVTLIDYIRRKEQFRYSPIIVITGQPGGYSEARIEREYLIHGYINKSDSVDVVEEVRKIIVQHRISRRGELERYRAEAERNMGSCPAMQELFTRVQNCARVENTVVYIDGETGTGKTLVAEYFHNIGNRGGQFVDYNCSTPVGTDENILKSILFGARKGFLSADHKGNEGLIRQAENGTLFLDEFQNVGGEIQAMLIRVIESGQYRALGSEEVLRCNVNFLIAGNRNLRELVREKQIREDFYFRILDVLEVPPLRERRSDIPYFIGKFMAESNRRLHKYVSIADGAVEKMERYDWPGNVRQLKNVIERAVLHCRGYEITADNIDLGPAGGGAAAQPAAEVGEGDFLVTLRSLVDAYLARNSNVVRAKNPKDRAVVVDMDEYKAVLLDSVMEATGGNKKATAQLLGVTVEQLATLLRNGEK